MGDLENLLPHQLIQVAAGVRCPCGHLSENHQGPGGLPGEKWGACNEDDCGCKGVIDMLEEVEEV